MALLGSCATATKPVAIIGINGCKGFYGDLVVLSDGRIVPRIPDDAATATAIAKALGSGHSGMLNPVDECPPTQNTKL